MTKLAVVGSGRFGANHVRTLHEIGRLAAVVDSSAEALEKFSELPEDIKRYSDLSQSLLDQSIGGYIIATPAATHADLAVQILEAGKPCLIEKPMTLSAADADRVLVAADKAQVPVLVGHLLLFQPAMNEIRRLIDEGAVGNISHIACRRTKLGTVRGEENVLWSFAPHDLSVIFWLLGGLSPTSATGIGEAFRGQREDCYHLEMQFDDAGRTISASVFVSWMWPVDERSTVIVGDRGMIVYDEQAQKLEVRRRTVDADLAHQDHGNEEIPLSSARFLTLEDEHFIACIEKRAEPLPSAVNGANVVRVLEQVSPYKS